jgi:hypothetical protein
MLLARIERDASRATVPATPRVEIHLKVALRMS